MRVILNERAPEPAFLPQVNVHAQSFFSPVALMLNGRDRRAHDILDKVADRRPKTPGSPGKGDF